MRALLGTDKEKISGTPSVRLVTNYHTLAIKMTQIWGIQWQFDR